MADRTLAIIALVLAFLIPPVGLILGIVSLVKKSDGHGFAIAAVVIGAIGTIALPLLIFIGTAAYFGVLNPESFVSERCTLQAGLACMDYAYTSAGEDSGFEVMIANGMGRTIEITNARFLLDDWSICETIYTEPRAISNGESFTISAYGPGCVTTRSPVLATIEIDYTTPGAGDTRTARGELFVRT